jgi:pimeloyl-ACP methyl ester carboxylesterase
MRVLVVFRAAASAWLLLPLLMQASVASAQEVVGDWQGTLSAGGMELRLVIRITRGPDGQLAATLDSIDQGATGIPVASVSVKNNLLTLNVPQVGGTFDGIINADGTIDGVWAQGAGRIPLLLTRAAAGSAFEIRRPQNPVPPYPYREEEVRIEHTAAGITLAGTLTLPQGNGPFPAVLLITGSGPQDRDESIAGHRPFLVLADNLTRRGLAVLRTDDRGVGGSTGDFSSATMEDFTADAAASVAYLRARSDIDGARIGVLGHSEGAVVAPMLAVRDPRIGYLVLLAGTGVPGADVLIEQNRLVGRAMGMPGQTIEENLAVLRASLEIVREGGEVETMRAKLREQLSVVMPPSQGEPQVAALTTPWFRHFVAYDPATALRQVRCPVLALNGSKDLQVPPSQNLPAIRKALEAGGNKRVLAQELPGLNHLFQTAATGAPAEYATIEETINPAVLQIVGDWVSRR